MLSREYLLKAVYRILEARGSKKDVSSMSTKELKNVYLEYCERFVINQEDLVFSDKKVR